MTLAATNTRLTGNFTFRPTTMDDLEAVFALVQIHMREYFGGSNQTVEDLRSEWNSPKFDVSQNTICVVTAENQLVGYGEVWDTREVPVRPFTWGFVHPDFRGQGIGTRLRQWMEQRARQVIDRVPEHARVVMMSDCFFTDRATKHLLESQGMTTERRSWLMLIEMDRQPDAPVWPDGITVTSLAESSDLEAVYHAVKDSFRDHRGFVEESDESGLSRFRHWTENDPNFDPGMWLLAMDGDRIAGISLCREKSWDDPDKGWVNTLGVRREYRRRGVALALLEYTFGEMWRRGQRKVGLGVDATSLTGATRLYEKAGMHVQYAFDQYEKELRPGVEISNQGQES